MSGDASAGTRETDVDVEERDDYDEMLATLDVAIAEAGGRSNPAASTTRRTNVSGSSGFGRWRTR